MNTKTKNKKGYDPEIMSLMSSPNAWTKEIEDLWLKQPTIEIMKRFPPKFKLYHIKRRGRTTGFL